jgi:acyl-ACP thioesterase
MKKINLWSENIRIRAYMVDASREANLVAIQNLCQEVAGNHANACELGYEAMQKRGMAWVLNRLKINILKQPKWTETVTVKTWVSVMQPFSHRHFQIVLPVSETNETELILANAYALWIPIDLATKRPKRMANEDFPLYEYAYDCEMPEKLLFTVLASRPLGEGGIFSSERIVQYSDLDMLGHVNNAKYVEWLLDDYFRTHGIVKVKTLDINYLGEVFQGSIVQFFVQQTDDTIFYAIIEKASGKEVCRAKLLVF